MIDVLTITLRHERDNVRARSAARHVARLLGFEHQDQIRIATAVSELARAAAGSDGRGSAVARFLVDEEAPAQRLVIRVTGERLQPGQGDAAGARETALLAARRLLERYEDITDSSGDTVSLALTLPPGVPAVDASAAARAAEEIEQLEAGDTGGYLAELKQQNRELSSTLLELEKKQHELERLNAELADTNRGVMALYAELDERAKHLRQADELKTKFLSYMSHEFRTPLNSILALSSMLLERLDGPLTDEQAKQVRLIRDSSSELFDLVSDLLDLAKVEAGKVQLSVGRFTVDELFGALRGMLRPLSRSPSVSLEFDSLTAIPPILGDEGKVAQVLRNFLSNALKFTESGHVRASARLLGDGEQPPGHDAPVGQESILFCVEDTGIGIAPEDQSGIFEEFTQVPHSLQRGVRGTGLGLPLCRKLASLMGGEVWLDSEPGRGSTFYLLVPRFHRPTLAAAAGRERAARSGADAREGASRDADLPLLVVSDLGSHRRALEQLFADSGFAAVAASEGDVSAELLSTLRPRVAVVDVSASSGNFTEGRSKPRRLLQQAGIPLVAAEPVDPAGAADTGTGPRFDRSILTETYSHVLRRVLGHVLVVDDDETFQHVMERRLQAYCRQCTAIGDSSAALAAAGEGTFDGVVLDLMMPNVDGFAVLTHLRDTAATARLPVLICSSRTPTSAEWSLLQHMGAAFVPKSELEPESLGRGLAEAFRRASRRGEALPPVPRAAGAH